MKGRVGLAGLLAVLALALNAGPAGAATISNILSGTDEATNNGSCSLRNAVEIHNDSTLTGNELGCSVTGDPATDPSDTIQLESGVTYELAGAAGDIANLSGDLNANSGSAGDLVISGVPGGPAETIDANGISGPTSDRVLSTVVSAGFLTFNDVTLTGGSVAGPGGALQVSGDLTLNDSVVTGNATTGGSPNSGGGISLGNGDLVLNDSSVHTNTSSFTAGGIRLSGSSPNLVANGDSHIDDNIAASEGGGIRVDGTGADITLNEGTTVSGNDAVFAGGGIRNNSGSAGSDIFVNGATISGNTVTKGAGSNASGGGISFIGPGEVELTDAIVTGNTLTGDLVSGAGITTDNSTAPGLTITGTEISNNTAIAGDTMSSHANGGAGLRTGGAAPATITDSTISGNDLITNDATDSAAGGGIKAEGTLDLISSTVTDNTLSGGTPSGRRGAGLAAFNQNGPTRILNSTFTANDAGGGSGGAISISTNATNTLVLTHDTIASNLAGTAPAIHIPGATDYIIRGSVISDGLSACSPGLSTNDYNADAGISCVGAGPDNDFETIAATLGALAGNGGPTQTMALTGPPALIDGVPSATDCNQLDGATDLLVDQRGAPRPFDSNDDTTAGCEPGAYELLPCQGLGATIWGTNAGEAIDGTPAAEVITGLDGADQINGHGGADTICGDDGDDTLLGGSEDAANDTLDGGGNSGDTVSYSDLPMGATVTATLTFGTAFGLGGFVGNDLLVVGSFRHMLGSNGGDILTGDGSNNTITGAGGNDILDGKLGDDSLLGGADTNTATFTANVPVVADLNIAGAQDTGQGMDTLTDIDNLTGSNAAAGDQLTGDGNDNVLLGGDGTDTLTGNGGADSLTGGADADQVFAGTGADDLFLRDGVVDTADCGVDADVDEVQTDEFATPDVLTNCGSPDLIDYLGGIPQPPPATPPASTPAPAPATKKKCRKGFKLKKVKGKKKCVKKKRRR